MPGRGAEISDRERMWAHAYCGPARFNGNEASRISGVSIPEGKRIARRPHVLALVEKLLQERSQRWELSAKRWIEEVLALAYSDALDLLEEVRDESGEVQRGQLRFRPLETLAPQVRAAVSRVQVKADGTMTVEMHNKVSPLRILGQYMRLFGDDAPLPPGAPDPRDVSAHRDGRDEQQFLGGLTVIAPGGVPETMREQRRDDGQGDLFAAQSGGDQSKREGA